MSKAIDWKTDENSILHGVATHDAILANLSYDVGKMLELTIRNTDNDLVRFNMVHPINLRMADFLDNLIIANIFVWPVTKLSTKLVAGYGWKQLFEFLGSEEQIQKAASKILSKFPHYLLVQFSSSYGGEIAVVCERLEVHIL